MEAPPSMICGFGSERLPKTVALCHAKKTNLSFPETSEVVTNKDRRISSVGTSNESCLTHPLAGANLILKPIIQLSLIRTSPGILSYSLR